MANKGFSGREHLVISALAFFNGLVIYPYYRRVHREFFSINAKPTHFAFFDIEVDGVDQGRVDFELFGTESPKSVNNFLGLCSGEWNSLY